MGTNRIQKIKKSHIQKSPNQWPKIELNCHGVAKKINSQEKVKIKCSIIFHILENTYTHTMRMFCMC